MVIQRIRQCWSKLSFRSGITVKLRDQNALGILDAGKPKPGFLKINAGGKMPKAFWSRSIPLCGRNLSFDQHVRPNSFKRNNVFRKKGKKKPQPKPGFLKIKARRAILTLSLPSTTFAAERLNCRVRDGIGCFTFAIDTLKPNAKKGGPSHVFAYSVKCNDSLKRIITLHLFVIALIPSQNKIRRKLKLNNYFK